MQISLQIRPTYFFVPGLRRADLSQKCTLVHMSKIADLWILAAKKKRKSASTHLAFRAMLGHPIMLESTCHTDTQTEIKTRTAALRLWEGLSHSASLRLIIIVLKSHSALLRQIVIVLKCHFTSMHLVVIGLNVVAAKTNESKYNFCFQLTGYSN